jgi:hypothetical protein
MEESAMEKGEQKRGRQKQSSRQSGSQGGQSGAGSGKSESTHRNGIGASQGQDEASRERDAGRRPSAGTADIERSEAGVEADKGNVESMVGESTGAYKERP